MDMRSTSTFEQTAGEMLERRGIEGKLGVAIRIILLDRWGTKGAHFRPLQEKLIQQYADATLLDLPAP